MSVQYICIKCRENFRAPNSFFGLCRPCMREEDRAARCDDVKAALADGLVRGVPSVDQREELK
jgi:hypothetical protein